MTKEKAQKEVQRLASEAGELLRKAEEIAKLHKVDFSFYHEYGIGGTFFGDEKNNYLNHRVGWVSSSEKC